MIAEEKMEKTKKGILISTVMVSIFTIVIKFLGLVKQSVLAAYCGATIETDAFFVATGTMVSLCGTVFSALSISLLTIHTEVLVNKGRNRANELINAALHTFLPIAIILTLLFAMFSPVVARFLAPTYQGEQLNDLAFDIRIMSVEFILYCYYLTVNTVLETDKIFLPGKTIAFFQNVFLIVAAVAFYPLMGMNGMLYAFILSGVAECVFVTIAAKGKFRFVIRRNGYRSEIKKLVSLTIPLLLGNAMYEVNQIVDNQISTGLGNGSASVLNYGASIHDMVVGVIVTSISVVLFSHCSTWVAKKQINKVEKSLESVLIYLTLILLPITVICVIAGDQVVELFYGRGSFGKNETQQTYGVVIGYSLGFVFQAARANLVKVFYAFQDSKTPMANGMISIICNVVLSILLSRFIGISGVALATSIAMLIATILLLKDVKKYLPDFSYRSCGSEILKGLVATSFSTITLIMIRRVANFNILLTLLVEGSSVVLVYGVVLYLLKSQSIEFVINLIRKRK